MSVRIKAAFVCLLILVGIQAWSQTHSWNSSYPQEFALAQGFYQAHAIMFDSAADASGLDSKFFFSIVAPEVGHYQAWRDRIETHVVELFYIEMGSDHGNFSIGPFQMQPEFAEHVELEARKLGLETAPVGKGDEKSIRKQRIELLKTLEGSLTYLILFNRIAQRIFPEKHKTECDRLAFFATAYNMGFWKSADYLSARVHLKFYPRFGSERLAYSDMASEFYQSLVIEQER